MVMPSNNTSALVRQLGRLFPGRMGQLIGPGGWREPSHYLPYALDNGAFGAFTKGTGWDADAFVALLEKAKAADIARRICKLETELESYLAAHDSQAA